jgi:hypothetical protein
VIVSLVALALAGLPPVEHVTCVWPDDGERTIVEFRLTGTYVEPVLDAGAPLSHENVWHLDYADSATLVATATVGTVTSPEPSAFVENLVLNRLTGEMVLTTTALHGSPLKVDTVRGTCRTTGTQQRKRSRR